MSRISMGVAFGAGIAATTATAVGNELLNVSKQESTQDKKKAIGQGFVLTTIPPTLAAVGAGVALLAGSKPLAYTLGAGAIGAALGQAVGGVIGMAIAKD